MSPSTRTCSSRYAVAASAYQHRLVSRAQGLLVQGIVGVGEQIEQYPTNYEAHAASPGCGPVRSRVTVVAVLICRLWCQAGG
jgi:hypothetical protein